MLLSIDSPKCIALAQKCLSKDGIIAFPTDTVYGLASNIHSIIGLRKIYEAKNRPEEKALPVLIGDFEQMEYLVSEVGEYVWKIARAFWPGPLTIVLPKKAGLPEELTPYPTIGVRMPNMVFTLALLKQIGPLATTSANLSGGLNPTTAQDVLEQLGESVDLILDGGQTPGPQASTVVDATTPHLRILREGPISLSTLQTVLEQT
jgi:L-threonylcarbamoyladenylate synthase